MTDFIQVGKDVYQKVGTVTQQGSSKPKSKTRTKPKPKTRWQLMSKRQRDKIKAFGLMAPLCAMEVIWQIDGYLGILGTMVYCIAKLITG